MGRLDYLVNNAGYSHGRPLSDLDGVEVAEFERAFRVNTIGPLPSLALRRAAYACGSKRLDRQYRVDGQPDGVGQLARICRSKAALINLTRSLARVLAPEICVNVVCPRLVDTPRPRAALGDRDEAVASAAAAQAPPGRLLQADDVAVPVVFLLMDALQMTAEVMRIDGGGRLAAGI